MYATDIPRGANFALIGKEDVVADEPAQTTQLSKETYYRGKRDLLDADF